TFEATPSPSAVTTSSLEPSELPSSAAPTTEASSVPSGQPVSPVPTPPVSTVSPEALVVDWQRVPGDPGIGSVFYWVASAAANDRFVAIGIDGDLRAAAWTSG